MVAKGSSCKGKPASVAYKGYMTYTGSRPVLGRRKEAEIADGCVVCVFFSFYALAMLTVFAALFESVFIQDSVRALFDR